MVLAHLGSSGMLAKFSQSSAERIAFLPAYLIAAFLSKEDPACRYRLSNKRQFRRRVREATVFLVAHIYFSL